MLKLQPTNEIQMSLLSRPNHIIFKILPQISDNIRQEHYAQYATKQIPSKNLKAKVIRHPITIPLTNPILTIHQ